MEWGNGRRLLFGADTDCSRASLPKASFCGFRRRVPQRLRCYFDGAISYLSNRDLSRGNRRVAHSQRRLVRLSLANPCRDTPQGISLKRTSSHHGVAPSLSRFSRPQLPSPFVPLAFAPFIVADHMGSLSPSSPSCQSHVHHRLVRNLDMKGWRQLNGTAAGGEGDRLLDRRHHFFVWF